MKRLTSGRDGTVSLRRLACLDLINILTKEKIEPSPGPGVGGGGGTGREKGGDEGGGGS